jgi:hypothetical protein
VRLCWVRSSIQHCLESWPSNQEKAVGLQRGRVGQDSPPTTELALFSQACHVTRIDNQTVFRKGVVVRPKHGCTLGKRVPNLGQPRCWPSVSPCCMTSTIEPGQTTPSLLIGYNLKPDPNSCGKPKFDCPTKCLESWPSNQEKAVGLQKGRVGQDTPPTTELALFSQACHVT